MWEDCRSTVFHRCICAVLPIELVILFKSLGGCICRGTRLGEVLTNHTLRTKLCAPKLFRRSLLPSNIPFVSFHYQEHTALSSWKATHNTIPLPPHFGAIAAFLSPSHAKLHLDIEPRLSSPASSSTEFASPGTQARNSLDARCDDGKNNSYWHGTRRQLHLSCLISCFQLGRESYYHVLLSSSTSPFAATNY